MFAINKLPQSPSEQFLVSLTWPPLKFLFFSWEEKGVDLHYQMTMLWEGALKTSALVCDNDERETLYLS